jgi:hypothetical protein
MLAGHPREFTWGAVWLRAQASSINVWPLIVLGFNALGPRLFHCFVTLQIAGWGAGTARGRILQTLPHEEP